MENQEVKEGLKDFSKEAEVDLVKVKEAMNLISAAFRDHNVNSTDGHVALGLLLRKSGSKELYDFIAAQMDDSFYEKFPTDGVKQ